MTKTPGTKPPSRVVRLRARVARLEGKIQRGDALQQRRKEKLAVVKKRLEVAK